MNKGTKNNNELTGYKQTLNCIDNNCLKIINTNNYETKLSILKNTINLIEESNLILNQNLS